MGKSESTKDFFEARVPALEINSQFNVFEREVFSRTPMVYNRRSFYKIALMQGVSRVYYADKGIEIDRPAITFSNPLVPYSWEAVSKEQEGYFCIFTEDFLKVKDQNLALHESPLFRVGGDHVFFINDEQLEYMNGIFKNMMREVQSDYVHKFDVLRNLVNLILHEALKLQPTKTYFQHQNSATRIAALFLELLDRQFPVDSPQHALQLKTPVQYAENLSVHVNSLNRAVRDVTGKTTTEHLNERIVNEAKYLLANTEWTISEIAYSLGYEYPTYFNNVFKKLTGITPGSLR